MPSRYDLERFVRDVLHRHDPVHVGLRLDEYDLEVRLIVEQLGAVRSVEQLRTSIHKTFVSCFGVLSAGDASQYSAVANEIWTFLALTRRH